MAFPFGWNPPSLGSFIETCVQGYGARVVTLDFQVEGSFGTVRPRILERTVNGQELHVVLPNDPDDVLISLHLVANMCRRLGIPTDAFRFEFDDEVGLVKINSNNS